LKGKPEVSVADQLEKHIPAAAKKSPRLILRHLRRLEAAPFQNGFKLTHSEVRRSALEDFF
jgi:hypothetical protein